MAEATPKNQSTKKVGASNRPQNFNAVKEQLMGVQSQDAVIAALENTPKLVKGSRQQPSIIKFPENIGQAEIPHIMQFKIFWRWERPDLANKADELKKESKANVEALQSFLDIVKKTEGDVYERDTQLAKLISKNSYLQGLMQQKGLFKDMKSMAEENLAVQQATLNTLKNNRAELLGKTPHDADERLALRSGINQQLANLNPVEAGGKAGLLAGAAQFFSSFAGGRGNVRQRLASASVDAAKTGLLVGVGTGVAAALAKYTQAEPVYDQMVSIYLPICNQINNTDVFTYKQSNMAVAGGLMDVLGGPVKETAVQGAQALATKVADTKGLGDAVSAFTGTVVNPRLEKIFQEKGIRNFNFSWEFFPRSEEEVEQVKNIIDTFRYHSHPAISASSSDMKADASAEQKQAHSKMMLRVPAEYEVRFLSSNASPDTIGYEENEYIPKIGRFVIENIQVEYTPHGGFSTFVNNAPTAVKITLTANEVTQLTREHVEAGY